VEEKVECERDETHGTCTRRREKVRDSAFERMLQCARGLLTSIRMGMRGRRIYDASSLVSPLSTTTP
jgi:hypothetical protein